MRILILTLSLFLGLSNANAFDLGKGVTEIRLDNGMKWLLVERKTAPIFSGVVMVRAGGADETKGNTGVAHIFEHMAFKGTASIGTKDFEKEKPILDKIEEVGEKLVREKNTEPQDKRAIRELERKLKQLSYEASKYQLKNEMWELLLRNGGGDLNAYTTKDLTAYYASMPINKLELWMRVFSDLIKDPIFREFYSERDVVLEERRNDVENDPDGKMMQVLLEKAFVNGPYSWPVLGSEEDISNLTIADARQFHKNNYVANRMVGVLVGDFESTKIKKLISKYFDSIASGEEDTKADYESNTGNGVTTFDFKAGHALVMAYHKPTLPDKKEYIFDVIQTLMCDGPTSRLKKRLIYDERIASRISCYDSYPASRLDNLFIIFAYPNISRAPEDVINAMREEIERLKNEPVPDEILLAIKNKIEGHIPYSLENNIDLATTLAEFETIFGDWSLVFDYSKNIDKVTPEDIMRTAKDYLTKENETIIIRRSK